MKEWIIPIASILSVTIAAAGFFVAANRFKKQTHLTAFVEFSRRFDDVMKELPEKLKGFHIHKTEDLPPHSRQQTEAVDRVLAMLSQEFYLYKKGYLGKDIWSIWEPGIKGILRSPLVVRDWDVIRHRYDVYPEFTEYVEAAQQVAPTDPP